MMYLFLFASYADVLFVCMFQSCHDVFVPVASYADVSFVCLFQTEQFLKLMCRFRELGFTRDKIQSALLTSDLNENKALDILTSS